MRLLCFVQAPVYLRDYARVHFTGTKTLQTKVSGELPPPLSPVYPDRWSYRQTAGQIVC